MYTQLIPTLLVLVSCNYSQASDPIVQPIDVREPGGRITAEDIFRAKCASCHNPSDPSGPFEDILNEQELVQKGIINPSVEPKKTRLYQSLVRIARPMPLGGTPLPQGQLQIIEDYIKAVQELNKPKPPITPAAYSYGQVVKEIAQDVVKLSRHDALEARYLLFNHLSHDAQKLQAAKDGLAKLLNSVSFNPEIIQPVEIDSNGLILRFFLEDYQLDAHDWDTLLVEYPYGIKYFDDEDFAFAEALIENKTGTKLAYIKGDWFISTAGQAPLYYQFLFSYAKHQPKTLAELEHLLGIDRKDQTQRAIDGLDERMYRWGQRRSGVALHNRMAERYYLKYTLGGAKYEGSYWITYDVKNDLHERNVFENPFTPFDVKFLHTKKVFQFDAGEILFTLPNGLMAGVLVDGKGVFQNEAPTDIAFDPDSDFYLGSGLSGVVVAGISCLSCHGSGMNSPVRDLMPAIEGTAGFDNAEYDFAKDVFYQNDQTLLTHIKDFNTQFQASLTKTMKNGVKASYFVKKTEPVRTTTKDHLLYLDVADMGRELYLDEAEVKQRLLHAPDLAAKLGMGTSLGKVSRFNFEKNIADIYLQFNLGKALVFKKVGVKPKPPVVKPKPNCFVTIANKTAYNTNVQISIGKNNKFVEHFIRSQAVLKLENSGTEPAWFKACLYLRPRYCRWHHINLDACKSYTLYRTTDNSVKLFED